MNVKQTVPLLTVTDIQRSVEFYFQGLGFQIIHKWEPNGKLTWCWLQHDDAALMLQQPDEEDPHWAHWGKGVTVYFICDDVGVIYSEITFRGIKASKPKTAFYGMTQTFIIDPMATSYASRVKPQRALSNGDRYWMHDDRSPLALTR